MPSKDDPFRKLLHNRHCLGIVSLGSIYKKQIPQEFQQIANLLLFYKQN